MRNLPGASAVPNPVSSALLRNDPREAPAAGYILFRRAAAPAAEPLGSSESTEPATAADATMCAEAEWHQASSCDCRAPCPTLLWRPRAAYPDKAAIKRCSLGEFTRCLSSSRTTLDQGIGLANRSSSLTIGLSFRGFLDMPQLTRITRDPRRNGRKAVYPGHARDGRNGRRPRCRRTDARRDSPRVPLPGGRGHRRGAVLRRLAGGGSRSFRSASREASRGHEPVAKLGRPTGALRVSRLSTGPLSGLRPRRTPKS